MILTCPECASRYFVDDDRVGPKGRTVRCASCGVTWRAMQDAAESGSLAAPAIAAFSMPSDVDAAESDVAPRTAPLPGLLRAEAMEKKKTREAVVAGVAWAGLGTGFVGLVLAAALFRVDIVRLWPQAASAYAFAKMPVNPTGLVFETVQGQPNLLNGHAALSVTGIERNVETGSRPSMPLRVVLYDKTGKRLISAVSAPPPIQIAPGDTKPFAVNFIDPPAESSSFVVEFAFDKVNRIDAKATPKTSANSGAAPLALRGSAATPSPQLSASIQPQTAKPLPADSPYALPSSANVDTTR